MCPCTRFIKNLYPIEYYVCIYLILNINHDVEDHQDASNTCNCKLISFYHTLSTYIDTHSILWNSE